MRLLFPDRESTAELKDAELAELYAFGPGVVVRSNFVSTLDGAATGSDGLSGSINDSADHRVFALQRRLCDAILVGAGTAEAEGYRRIRPVDGHVPVVVVVSARGRVPEKLAEQDPERGPVLLVTRRAAGDEAITNARSRLGRDAVWVLGDEEVDLATLVARLGETGRGRVLCEGGPSLHASLLAAGLVDELALTSVGRIVAGDGPRIAGGPGLDVTLDPRHLLLEGATVLGLWTVRRDH